MSKNLPTVFQEWVIRPLGQISEAFLEKGIKNFEQASLFVQTLPYKRNKNKEEVLSVLKEHCGTCSTKHALLKRLAEENHFEGLSLWLGIFRMNAQNTPSVALTLQQNGLAYLPEAHNYLKFGNTILDYTLEEEKALIFENELLDEIIISPEQIGAYKIAYHKKYLAEWLLNNSNIPLTLEELWKVREQCIQALAE